MCGIEWLLEVFRRLAEQDVNDSDFRVLLAVGRLQVCRVGQVADAVGRMSEDRVLKLVTKLMIMGLVEPISIVRPRQYRLTDAGTRFLERILTIEYDDDDEGV